MRERRPFWLVGANIVFASCLVLGFAAGCGNERAGSKASREGERSHDPDPGRLRDVMLQLGEDMNAISGGLWRGDLAAVEVAALAIAGHPHVSADERTRIQTALGPAFAEFARADRFVHDAAIRVAESAAAGNMTSTLDEMVDLQTGCVNCHEMFRERLRSSAGGSR